MPDAFDHCEQLVREGDKDRFFATLFAPQKYRRALYALYAFNLEVARAREAAREPLPGEVRLQWWRDVLAGGGRGEVAANPVAAALREIVVRYRLPPQLLVDLLDARTFDLYDDPMPSLSELELYAVRTSSALMEHAARILNDGIAYAITGLLRAFPIHAARRQLYLPMDVMERHGAQPEDAFAGKATPELRAALAELRLRARRQLAAARELVSSAPAAAAPALLPAALVGPALRRMDGRGYDPFRPADLPQWRRQWILWRAARRENYLD
jgi:phytoene synthase